MTLDKARQLCVGDRIYQLSYPASVATVYAVSPTEVRFIYANGTEKHWPVREECAYYWCDFFKCFRHPCE